MTMVLKTNMNIENIKNPKIPLLHGIGATHFSVEAGVCLIVEAPRHTTKIIRKSL